jgi:DNA-binding NtrC family response regulator
MPMGCGEMNEKAAILIVEDDAVMRETCIRMLSRAGYTTEAVADGEAALATLREDSQFRIVLLDLKLPKIDGTVVLKRIRASDADVKVIIMTGFATIKSAVQTMKLGAVDYLVKPFEKDELLAVVAQQLRVGELEERVEQLQSELHGKYRFDNIIGRSKKMERVFEQVIAACHNQANVLIIGESGTGKELIARAIHYNGPSPEGSFVAVNCAALPEALIESELFGHVKGAFTGAARDSVGLFRTAQCGTIFLDEVIDMPLETQAKLLRVIQEKTVRPVGGLSEVPIDVRVVAATNRDPTEALERGRLRKDLFYRLTVIAIHVPPLRERPEDIHLIVAHFATRFAKTYGFRIGTVCQEVMDVLTGYSWPGNIRELENLVERWFAMRRNDSVTIADLPAEMVAHSKQSAPKVAGENLDDVLSLRDAERALVRKALRAADDNKSKAANLLGISRKKLYKLLSNEASSDTAQPE